MSRDAAPVRVAAVQAAPVLFDRLATLTKVEQLTAEAAALGAQLILFPEAFIPAYPRGLSFGTVVGRRSPEGRQVWQRYWDNAVDVPGPVTEARAGAARQAGVHLAIGVIERGRAGPAALSTAPSCTSGPTGLCSASTASSSPRRRSVSSGGRATAARSRRSTRSWASLAG